MRTPDVRIDIVITSPGHGLFPGERAVAAAVAAVEGHARAFTVRCSAAEHEENGLLEQVLAYRDLRKALSREARPGILPVPVIAQFYGGDAPVEAFYEQVEVGDCIPVSVIRSAEAAA